MQDQTIGISQFAKLAGNPLCDYMKESASYPENKSLERVWFMAGDPTVYGNIHMKLPKQAYEQMRLSINNKENHGYIDSTGDKPTKQAIIKHFCGEQNITPGDVIIVNGVNMGLLYCFFAFCEAGDNILVPEIGYPFYTDVAKSLGVEAREYRLLEDHNFEIDLEHAKTLIDGRTKYIYVINPSNPMGSVFSRKHMLQILNFAEQQFLTIVSDEVYYGQVFAGQQTISFGHLTKEVPVLVVSGMEKIYNVPGWCNSWLIMYDPAHHLGEIKTNLQKLASIFLHTNVFTQRATPGILDKLHGASYSKTLMSEIQKTHDKLYNRFKEWPCFKPRRSQGTFYLMVQIDLTKFKDFKTDKDVIKKLLEEENVNIFPLSVMGKRFNGFRMMTCATDKQYDELFIRLERFVKRWSI